MQPQWITDMHVISNYIFSAAYLIEMILKLLGFGIIGYLGDPFNLFDGTIVIISILEFVLQSESSGFAILRGFRLLRVLKLVKRFKGL
jgi:hypothetical protein